MRKRLGNKKKETNLSRCQIKIKAIGSFSEWLTRRATKQILDKSETQIFRVESSETFHGIACKKYCLVPHLILLETAIVIRTCF